MNTPYRIFVLIFVFFSIFGACSDSNPDPEPVAEEEEIENDEDDDEEEEEEEEGGEKDELKNITEKNLKRIHQFDTAINKPFKIVVLSDSHYFLDDLKDAVNKINERSDISFIIVTGDITENGSANEFETFHQIMSRAKVPYLTVIGNHDYFYNGVEIYKTMYGRESYSFTFHHVKFIAWDNVTKESKKEADYNWLSETLKIKTKEGTTEPFHHIIPLSHIPPFDVQMERKKEIYHALLRDNGVTLSVHGHHHKFTLGQNFGDGITYMIVGSPKHRSYASLSISPDKIEITEIKY